ncbi:MAG TPA: hypothetical protein VF808_17805 [Ktedonobacterales bacterium]
MAEQNPLTGKSHAGRAPWLGGLGSLALALFLMVGAVFVLSQGAWARGGPVSGSSQSPRTQSSSKPARLQRVDVHVETPYQGKDLEFSVSLTQTEKDCAGSFSSGAYCLRYALIMDEAPALAGYGMVPATDVHLTSGNIVIQVDTAKIPGFVVVLGSAQVVSVNWRRLEAQTKAGAVMNASAQGALGAYRIPSSGPVGTVIAHMVFSD